MWLQDYFSGSSNNLIPEPPPRGNPGASMTRGLQDAPGGAPVPLPTGAQLFTPFKFQEVWQQGDRGVEELRVFLLCLLLLCLVVLLFLVIVLLLFFLLNLLPDCLNWAPAVGTFLMNCI